MCNFDCIISYTCRQLFWRHFVLPSVSVSCLQGIFDSSEVATVSLCKQFLHHHTPLVASSDPACLDLKRQICFSDRCSFGWTCSFDCTSCYACRQLFWQTLLCQVFLSHVIWALSVTHPWSSWPWQTRQNFHDGVWTLHVATASKTLRIAFSLYVKPQCLALLSCSKISESLAATHFDRASETCVSFHFCDRSKRFCYMSSHLVAPHFD